MSRTIWRSGLGMPNFKDRMWEDIKKWKDRMWEESMTDQFEFLKKAYGKEAADTANYGWCQEFIGGNIRIDTKVHAVGRNRRVRILITTVSYPNTKPSHRTEALFIWPKTS